MGWFKTRQAVRNPPRRFAALQAMTPAERAAVLAGPDAPDWIEAAAQFGLVEGQVLFGQLLLDRGRPELAIRWFRAAAATGDAPARNMLGRCLELGWGTEPDPAAAAAQYRLAAEAGHGWGRFNLAMLLLYGLGLGRDRAEAFTWFTRAAADGHAKSANMLGRFHEEGWDRPRDLVRAAACYRQAAEGGDFRGQWNLATLLISSGHRAEAVELMRRAWRAGSADFLVEAGAALRRSGDPELMAITA